MECHSSYLTFVLAIFYSTLLSAPLYAQKGEWSKNSKSTQQALGSNSLYTRLRANQIAYRHALQKGDSAEIAEVCYLLGKRYSALGDYRTAQQWFIRSLSIREPKGYSVDIGKVYLRLTENHIHLRQIKQALMYGHRALLNSQKVKSDKGLMSSFIVLSGAYSLGWNLLQKKKYKLAKAYNDSSLYYMHQAESMASKIKDSSETANIYWLLSGTYLSLRNDKFTALEYSKRALILHKQQKNYHSMIFCLLQMQYIYKNMKKFDEALASLNRAQQLSNKYHAAEFSQTRDLELAYYQIYQHLKNWKLALHHLEKYHELEYQILALDRDGAISKLGLQYETEKKEIQLKAQNRELALQEKLMFLMLGIISIVIVISIVLYLLFKKNRRIRIRNANLVHEQNHRVKNNLQIVSSLLSLHVNRINDPVAIQAVEESQLRVQAIAVLHRRLYDGEQLIKVNLATYIPDVIEGVLQTYGFTTLIPFYRLDSIWLHVDQSVPLGLIINELITNACKYAFLNHPTPMLSITCHQWQRQISLSITDNGPGFTASLNHTSFGMWLIDLQAEQLAGTYRFDCTAGTTFRLSFKS